MAPNEGTVAKPERRWDYRFHCSQRAVMVVPY